MRIASNNVLANAGLGAADGRRRSARRNNIIADRTMERRREMKMQERENERIRNLHDKISSIKNNSNLSIDNRTQMIRGITDQIASIYERRAEREEQAAEREMMRQKILIEELTSKMEMPEKEYDDPEEAEKARHYFKLYGAVNFASSKNTLQTLKQTRAALASESGHLRRAIKNPNSAQINIGIIPASDLLSDGKGIFIDIRLGTGTPDDFRNTHKRRLNDSIASLDGAIAAAIGSMYRESLTSNDLVYNTIENEEREINQDKTKYEYDYEFDIFI